MRLKPVSYKDISTPTGLMRTHFFEPLGEQPRPAIILFSEIYQMTGPIARTAAMLAGQGYIVAVPDVYHEFTTPGEVFPYDKEGTDRGNSLKITKDVAHFDADAKALIDFLIEYAQCTGKLGAMGICLGGHLAFRAAMNPQIKTTVCLYATDIHQGSLGKGKCDNSLDRIPEIQGELLMVWGRQDPHIPREGRRAIYDGLSNAAVHFTWHEFNGEHAFLRDEGHRYDPELAQLIYGLAFSVFERQLKS